MNDMVQEISNLEANIHYNKRMLEALSLNPREDSSSTNTKDKSMEIEEIQKITNQRENPKQYKMSK